MPRPKRSVEDARMAAEVGRRLLEVRGGENLSQDEFILRLGKGTRRTWAHYEAGKASLPSALARLVCEKFDVNFDWLMTGKGPRKKSAVVGEMVSRRLEAEARDMLGAVQDVIRRHAYSYGRQVPESSLGGLLDTTLRVSLGRLERDFREKFGVQQFVRFLDDLLSTMKAVFGDAIYIEREVLRDRSIRAEEKAKLRSNRSGARMVGSRKVGS